MRPREAPRTSNSPEGKKGKWGGHSKQGQKRRCHEEPLKEESRGGGNVELGGGERGEGRFIDFDKER